MCRAPKLIPVLALIALLAGCNQKEPDVDRERQSRLDAVRRETEALQLAQRERQRREFWQTAAYTAAALAVVLLIVGTAVGSRSHDAGSKT